MGKPLAVLSNEIRVMIKRNGKYLSLYRGSQGNNRMGYDFLSFPVDANVKTALVFDVTIESSSSGTLKLWTNSGYSDTTVQGITTGETNSGQSFYCINKDDDSSRTFIFSQVSDGRNLFKIRDSSGWWCIINNFGNNYLIESTEQEDKAAEFEIEVIDKPETFFIGCNSDSYGTTPQNPIILKPQEGHNSFWMCPSSFSNVTDQEIEIDLHYLSAVDGYKTMYFKISESSDQWRFAEENNNPSGAIILGNVQSKPGISIVGGASIISSFTDDSHTEIEVKVSSNSQHFPMFVFRAEKNGEVYCSKDPTMTQRKPQ